MMKKNKATQTTSCFQKDLRNVIYSVEIKSDKLNLLLFTT